jgi:hypothetical protein
LPDLATGWRPKVLKIHPPILIKYKENFINNIINNLHTSPDNKLSTNGANNNNVMASNNNILVSNNNNNVINNVINNNNNTNNNNININHHHNNYHNHNSNGKLIYLGPRQYNSFNFHNKVKHDYHVRFTAKN